MKSEQHKVSQTGFRGCQVCGLGDKGPLGMWPGRQWTTRYVARETEWRQLDSAQEPLIYTNLSGQTVVI